MGFDKALEEFVRQRKGEGMTVAKVTSVDNIKMVFDCLDGDGNEYLDVRMNAVPGKSGVLAIPSVSASVIISDLGDKGQEYIMLQAGAIDELYIYVLNLTEVHVDDEEIRLGGGKVEPAVLGTKLNENLSELITQLDTLNTALAVFSTSQMAATTGPLVPLNPAYTILTPKLAAITTNLTALNQSLNDHLSEVVKVTP